MRRSLFFLIVSLFAILIQGMCFAQEQEVESREPLTAGPLTTWTAPLCGKGKFVVQPFFIYNRARGSFNSEGHYDPLAKGDKKYQYQEQIFMQYGLTERLEVDAQTIYQESYAKTSGSSAHSNGFGDSYVFLRYCLNEESVYVPQFNAIFQVKVPTGKFQKADPAKLGTDLMGATSGGGSWDQGLGIVATKELKPFVLHADFIYSFPNEVKVDGVKTRYANYFIYDFGIEYLFKHGFNLELEVNGFMQGDKKEAGSRTPSSDINYLIVSPGIGWSCARSQWLLAYQRVVIGTNTDANDSVVLTCVIPF